MSRDEEADAAIVGPTASVKLGSKPFTRLILEDSEQGRFSVTVWHAGLNLECVLQRLVKPLLLSMEFSPDGVDDAIRDAHDGTLDECL